jgi:hypothetical protein
MLISFAALILSLVAAWAADQKMGQGPQAGDVRVHPIGLVFSPPDRGEVQDGGSTADLQARREHHG